MRQKSSVQERSEIRANDLRGLNTREWRADAANARRHATQFGRAQEAIRPDKFNVTHTDIGVGIDDKTSQRRSANAPIHDGPRGGRAESQARDIGDRNWLQTFGGKNGQR
jgi:hypothetical protein